MTNENDETEQNTAQANNNSMAVGRDVAISGNQNSNIHVGNVINYISSEETKSPLETETIEIEEGTEPETILIPAGTVWLGSNPGVGIKDYETPRHEVTLSAYRMSRYPILNREYQQFLSLSPIEKSAPASPEWSGRRPKQEYEDQPVRGITWEDARDYCKWLSERRQRKYDLPNEAQLEKAYQGQYGCSDIVEDIYLWTCTLWGENLSPPDWKYPWKKEDYQRRNNPNANSQIRRVVCRYKKVDGADRSQRDSRSGQFPKKPLPPERYSFRIVMIG